MAHLSSKFQSLSQEWETPPEVFAPLDQEFHFTLDVCATDKIKKCNKFYSKEDDALTKSWAGVCWMNPPFNKLSDWVKKAYEEGQKGATIVCLIPARTNTNWWHSIVLKASEIRFILGRPKFNNAIHGLPQPLAIVIFRAENEPVKIGTFRLQNKKQPANKLTMF